MDKVKSISIEELVNKLDLEVVYMPENSQIRLFTSELIRPGMQLAGYFDLFGFERIQIMGRTEINYVKTLTNNVKIYRLDKFFSYPIPALIIANDQEIDSVILYCARKHRRPLLRTKDKTTKLISNLLNYLENHLAPEVVTHGVCMEIFGVGVLIKGKSGIGKSETALELIRRGHRLVADDAVVIRRVDNTLKSTAPELTKHLMEIRGIGLLDIKHLYGVGSIRIEKDIELVVELDEWDSNKVYERLGLDEMYEEILEVKVPKVIIPVKPGRNIPTIVELASKNQRQKVLGFNAAEVYNERFLKLNN